MKIGEMLDPKSILLRGKIDNAADALGILVELQEGSGVITNGIAYFNAVTGRETDGGGTGIGEGIALPHACNAGVAAPGISALTLRRGIEWGAPDGVKVDLLFMVAVPPDNQSLHLQILARLVNLLSIPGFANTLRGATSPEQFINLLSRQEDACFGT